MIRLFAERFEGFDAVVLPTTLNTAPAIAEFADDKDYFRLNGMALRNTYVGNFPNVCAISLPMQEPGQAPCGLLHGAVGAETGRCSAWPQRSKAC